MNILDLPPNITTAIFSFLDQQDLVSTVRKTCRAWYQLSYERILWKTIGKFAETVFTSNSFVQLVNGVCESVECLHLDLEQLDIVEILRADIVCPNLKELYVYCPYKHRLLDNADTRNGVDAEYENEADNVSVFSGRRCEHGEILMENLPKLSERYSNLRKLLVNGGVGLKVIDFLLDKFTNLEQIEVIWTKIEKSFDVFLENHKSINHITLRNCIISEETLSTILSRLPCIELLDLTRSNSKAQETDCWDQVVINETKAERFDKLKTLKLSLTTCDDGVLAKIVKYSPNLKHVSIVGCNRITNNSLDEIARYCPDLETLHVNDTQYSVCNITNAGLQSISENCKNLRVLQANYCPEVSDISIHAIAESCKQLRDLETAGCTALTDNAIQSLVENCHLIEKLNLGSCVQLTSKCVNAIFTKCKHLVYLNIETCHRLTNLDFSKQHENPSFNEGKCPEESSEMLTDDKNLKLEIQKENAKKLDVKTNPKYTDQAGGGRDEPLVFHQNQNDEKSEADSIELEDTEKIQDTLKTLENHSHIRILTLRFCSRLTNSCIQQISRYCPDLRELDIRGCSMVTNSGVKYVIQGCRYLETLDISGGSLSQTSRLTDHCLRNIADECINIRKLVIVKNNNITAECVFDVIKSCPNISLVSISHSERSNINVQRLKWLAGEVTGKTICLNVLGEVNIHVYKDHEIRLVQE